MKFEELQNLVLDWAEKKDLLHEENAEKQFMKFIEEVFEFKSEMDYLTKINDELDSEFNSYGEIYYDDEQIEIQENMQLEMGDIFVTLIILCKQLEIDPVKCLEQAYKKIKNRKGKTINGQFVKEEDL